MVGSESGEQRGLCSKWQRRMGRMGSWQLAETNCSLLWPEVGLTFSGPVRSRWSIPEAPRGFMFYHSASSMFFICCVDSAAAVCPGTVRGQVPLERCPRQPLNMLRWQYLQGRPFTGPRESLASSWSKSTRICKKNNQQIALNQDWCWKV